MRIVKLLTYISLLLMAVVADGCSDIFDVADPSQTPVAGDEDAVYLRLTLNTNKMTSTRAEGDTGEGGSATSHPEAGEDGDGREQALPNEYLIYDLNIFFYTLEGGNGLNCETPGNVEVKKHLFVRPIPGKALNSELIDEAGSKIEDIDVIYNDTIKVPGYKPGYYDYILAVANVGDSIKGVATLNDLKDMQFPATWRERAGGKAYYFTMATARTDGENSSDGMVLTKDRQGNRIDPFHAETTIERTAARIDFWYDDENEEKNSDGAVERLIYPVTLANGKDTGSKVIITHMVPVNVMKPGSYVFKHVTENIDSSSDVRVCGNEITDNYGFPGNYVLDPLTITKRYESAEDMFGGTRTEIVRQNEGVFVPPYDVKTLFSNDIVRFPGETDPMFERYHILCYANENTHWGTRYFTPEYLTGLAFKALYEPNVIYRTAETDADGNLNDIDSDWIPGMPFWRYSPSHLGDNRDVDESECVYFSSEDAAEAYRDADAHDATENGIVTEYLNGECYYNLWLKHANYKEGTAADPQELFPMQYGIVRNNIYRVGVSFSGPGDPESNMNGPINMSPKIFVRKWNKRPQEDEIIF